MNANDYQHSPDRLRAFLADHKLTGAQAAALIGADSRTIRRWTAPQDVKGARQMPFTAWYALHHIVTGKVPA
jgi:hypothetical protein